MLHFLTVNITPVWYFETTNETIAIFYYSLKVALYYELFYLMSFLFQPGFKQQKCIISLLWKLQAHKQMSNSIKFCLKLLETLRMVAAFLGLLEESLPSLCLHFHMASSQDCVSLGPNFFLSLSLFFF